MAAAAVPALLQLAVALPASAAAPPAAAAAQETLQSCAGIASDAERLGCYDRLAGRGTAATAAPPKAPVAAAAPSAPAAIASSATTAAAAPAMGAASAPLPKESFGLYAAEHPKLPAGVVAASLEAVVVAIGRTASGRMTVALEGGAVWELDEPDPLLAVGQTVTITRAALGSYIMYTPTKRTHRARRLH